MAEIAVAGEALIDLVVGTDGRVDAHPGGGPFNAARTMARLGVPTTFLGRLAGDGFGRLLRERLAAEGVGIAVPEPSGRPSTLAVVSLDDAGVASYSFYLDGTSVADLDYPAARRALPAERDRGAPRLPRPADGAGRHVHRAAAAADVPAGTLVLLDPNCRPGAVTDHDAFRKRVGVFARRADIVKASVEDLAYLYPDVPPAEAAAIAARGAARRSSSSPTARTRPARSCPAPSSPSRSPSSPSRTRSARVTRSAADSSPGGRRTASAGKTSATRNWSAARSAPPPRSPPSPAPARARTRQPAPTCGHGTGGPSRGRRGPDVHRAPVTAPNLAGDAAPVAIYP